MHALCNGVQTFNVGDRADLPAARAQATSPDRPVLIHLNADTSWLLQLPYPAEAARPAGRRYFNILIDPWLQGPQSDVASWFSTQWHAVAPAVHTIDELDELLASIEGVTRERAAARTSLVDAVAISHEFTDHCHEATLRELPRDTPVFATELAADLIRSWRHFDTVVTTPGFSSQTSKWQEALKCPTLPDWLGVGRVITAGNALYYHSAVIIAFQTKAAGDGEDLESAAVIYSPHGIKATDLAFLQSSGLTTRALLHGLHDVRIWMAKQLNLGALNGLEAVRACGAKYWIATHDEVKTGGGFIAPLLRRTQYTLQDAVNHETKAMGAEAPRYQFVELGSGDGFQLI